MIIDIIYERKNIMRININLIEYTHKHLFRIKREYLFGLFAFLFIILSLPVGTYAEENWPSVAISQDGTPISYEVYGSGETTLVFVHGWSCDSRYWQKQLPVFSKKYRVVVFDLAGHGHSGLSRVNYRMSYFGEDVKAVTEAVGAERVILIGHSMGGAVIVEAARLMPDRVIGLIGVDTFNNVEFPATSEIIKNMLAPLEKNFKEGSKELVKGMLLPETDKNLREWILSDMSSAPPRIAISAVNDLLSRYSTGESTEMFKGIKIPIIAVNADLEPTDIEANRKHMYSFDTIIIKNADHFLMMAKPVEFNKGLQKAINRLTGK